MIRPGNKRPPVPLDQASARELPDHHRELCMVWVVKSSAAQEQ